MDTQAPARLWTIYTYSPFVRSLFPFSLRSLLLYSTIRQPARLPAFSDDITARPRRPTHLHPRFSTVPIRSTYIPVCHLENGMIQLSYTGPRPRYLGMHINSPKGPVYQSQRSCAEYHPLSSLPVRFSCLPFIANSSLSASRFRASYRAAVPTYACPRLSYPFRLINIADAFFGHRVLVSSVISIQLQTFSPSLRLRLCRTQPRVDSNVRAYMRKERHDAQHIHTCGFPADLLAPRDLREMEMRIHQRIGEVKWREATEARSTRLARVDQLGLGLRRNLESSSICERT